MRIAVLLLIPALLLTGCGAGPDAAYLSAVRASAPSIAGDPDADLVELGHNVCDLLKEAGYTKGLPLVIANAKEIGLTATEAGKIVGAAVAVYCPTYSDDL